MVLCNLAIAVAVLAIVVALPAMAFCFSREAEQRSDRGAAEGVAVLLAAGVVLSLVLGLCVVLGARP